MNRRHSLGTAVAIALAAAAFFPAARPVAACDTPVYRYAMYRWTPAPYEIYYFHTEPPAGEDAQVAAEIKRLAGDDQRPANFIYTDVDLNDDPDLKLVPADVKEKWLAVKERSAPGHLVVSHRGALVYDGRLKPADVAAVADSPARQKAARLLAEGHAGVLLLVEGKDSQANAAAEKAARGLILDIASGKLNLYSGARDKFPELPGTPKEESKEDAEQGVMPPGLVKIARDDSKETWLVRMLTAVESDLAELTDQPMLFCMYGRGRIMPPMVGAGISRENLLDVAYFMTGACSCTVKEQNPGIDVVTRFDWDAASKQLAEKYGSEEGNERVYGAEEFFPDLIIPAGGGSKSLDDPPGKEGSKSGAEAKSSGGSAASPKPHQRRSPARRRLLEEISPPQEAAAAESSGGGDADQDGDPGDSAAADETDSAGGGEEAASNEEPSRRQGEGRPRRRGGEGARGESGGTASADEAANASAPGEGFRFDPLYSVGIAVGAGLFALLGISLVVYRT